MVVDSADLGHNDMIITMRRFCVHEEQLAEFEPGMNLPYAACVSFTPQLYAYEACLASSCTV